MDKEKIEYRYEFANGDKVEISISNARGMSAKDILRWIPLLKKLDLQERNNDKKERRRHVSLEAYDADGNHIMDKADVYGCAWFNLFWDEARNRLTTRERLIADMFFRQGYTQAEIGEAFDISQPRVWQIITHIREKMREFEKNL